ncbi:hypothetical protein KAR91_49810 [Candidatus Pacearchaeota archaeon]|nr:hypothetical protein [Candidatus Pacearchaeota archaeon]
MAWNGFGDTIKWFTGLFGIVPCAACERRRKWLNKIFPFRFKSYHDRMFAIQNKLWGRDGMSDGESAYLHLQYRDVIEEFFRVFQDKFHELIRQRQVAFHILYIDGETLHCAMVPPIQGGKFTIGRKARRLLRNDIEKDILEKTKFEKVKWHV